jgi:hypothetical protein
MVWALWFERREWRFVAGAVEGVAEEIDDEGGAEDFGGEEERGGGGVEGVGVEGEGEEGSEEAEDAEEGDPEGDGAVEEAFCEEQGTEDGDGEHDEVGEGVELGGGVVEDVEGFGGMDAGGAEHDEGGDDGGGDEDGVGGRAVAGVESGEPGGDEVVPAGGHGKTRDAGEDVAGGAEDADLEKKDDEAGKKFCEDSVVARVPEGQAERLGDGGDVVDGGVGEFIEGEHGGGAEDEHDDDDGAGDENGAADVSGGGFGFAGHDGDVLEAGGGEEGLTDESVGGGVGFGEVELEGGEVDGEVVGVGPEGREDEQGEGGHHGSAGDVVDPFAEGEALDGGEGEEGEEDGERGEDDEVVVGDPGGGGADHEGELAGELEEEKGDDDEAVSPDVPGGEEAEGVAEGAAGPDVEAAFEGHLAVEVIDGGSHGQVEGGEGEEPDEGLGVAEAGGETDPGAADDGEDLGEDEVAQRELAREVVIVGGGRGHWVDGLTGGRKRGAGKVGEGCWV